MTVTAPPRPPHSSDPLERDRLEALIEEARRRARRRRRINAAVATLVALGAVATITFLERDAASQGAASSPARSNLPAVAADRQIAFSRSRGTRGSTWTLFVMNADGSGERQLVRDSWSPDWSPDGQKIAFQKGELDEDSHIYVVNADGSGLRRLTRGRADEGLPQWSPDGRTITFVTWSRPLAPAEIYAVNADGSGLRRLTGNAAFESGHDWSPDGRRIVYARSIGEGNDEIYAMNADGTGHRRLTRSRQFEGQPSWSPDGLRIIFTRSSAPLWDGRVESTELFVVNADGSGLRRLIGNAFPGVAWAPDGGNVLFVSARDGEIYVVNADGTGLRRLTRNAFEKGPGPSWSPDGRQIAFTSSRDGNPEIYVMNADGTESRRLTQRPEWDWAPVWSQGG